MLLDNRTLYLDFFGFVMWDFVPMDANEIKQIEVVRGPGSAVWGANAMTGVIRMATILSMKYDQSAINALAGIAIKVMALSKVPKTLSPEAHQGMRPPPVK